MPIIAGAALLALANVALADEASLSTADQPILLTDAQMDSVTAGDARVGAFASGDVFVTGSYTLDNIPGVFAFANINADIIPFDDDAFVALSAFASLP